MVPMESNEPKETRPSRVVAEPDALEDTMPTPARLDSAPDGLEATQPAPVEAWSSDVVPPEDGQPSRAKCAGGTMPDLSKLTAPQRANYHYMADAMRRSAEATKG